MVFASWWQSKSISVLTEHAGQSWSWHSLWDAVSPVCCLLTESVHTCVCSEVITVASDHGQTLAIGIWFLMSRQKVYSNSGRAQKQSASGSYPGWAGVKWKDLHSRSSGEQAWSCLLLGAWRWWFALLFVLKVSLMVLLLLLWAFWDLGNGKRFVISVLVFETVISHSFELCISCIDIWTGGKKRKRGGSKD